MELAVSTILINWQRQNNIPLIVQALRRQSVPTKVILVDAGGGLSQETLDSVDLWIKLSRNFSSYNRFVASPLIDTKYSYFHDDDMIPGDRVIEHYLRHQPERHAVLGQHGRLLKGPIYSGKPVPRTDKTRVVNSVVRSYFTQTKNLYLFQKFLNEIKEPHPSQDDLALCFALRKYTRLPCAITPASDDPHEKACMVNLDDEKALWKKANHLHERMEFCKKVLDLGLEGVYWGEENGHCQQPGF